MSSLDDTEFFSSKEVREYCQKVRMICHRQSIELSIAAEELKAVLKEIPGNPFIANLDSKFRARQVSKHLDHAAEAQKIAAGAAVRTYAAFRKQFALELESANGKRRPRRKFDFKE